MPLLDIPTIYVLMLSVMVLLGALTLFAWLQNRAVRALAWWGGAVLVMTAALGLLCLRGTIPDFYSTDLAYAVLFTACALMLEGARCFEGRRPSLAILLAGALVWIVVCQIPALYDSATARMIIVSAIVGLYSLGCAYVLWSGRAEPLLSRWPLIVLTAFGGGLFLVRIPLVVLHPLAEAPVTSFDALRSFWFAIVSTFTLLFIIAINYLFLALTKERSELAHKRAADDGRVDRPRQPARLHGVRQATPERACERSGCVPPVRSRLVQGHQRQPRAMRWATACCACSRRRCPRICRAAASRGGSGARSSPQSSAGLDQRATIAAAERVRESFGGGSVSWTEFRSLPRSASASHRRMTGRPTSRRYASAPTRPSTGRRALGRNRVESAVDERIPLVPDAPVEARVTPADPLIAASDRARRAMKQAAA